MSATLITDSGHPDAQDNDNSLLCDFRGCENTIGISTGDDSLAGAFGEYVLISDSEGALARYCPADAAWLVEVAPSIAAVTA